MGSNCSSLACKNKEAEFNTELFVEEVSNSQKQDQSQSEISQDIIIKKASPHLSSVLKIQAL